MTSSEKAKDTRLRKTYKITLEQQNAQIKEQNYECEICGRPFPPKKDEKGKTFTPQQDHDHKCCPTLKGYSKEFCGLCNRGLLCSICNRFVIGLIERLNIPADKLAAYIKKWGAILKQRGAYTPKFPIKKIRKRKRKAKK